MKVAKRVNAKSSYKEKKLFFLFLYFCIYMKRWIFTKLTVITVNAIIMLYTLTWASLVAQRLKRLPGMRETRAWSLGREDPLEKEIAPHSSTLACRIPWREEPGRLQSMGSQRVGHDWATSLHTLTYTGLYVNCISIKLQEKKMESF